LSDCTEVNWGSSTQAQIYRNALVSIQQLAQVEDHVKNYRPQLLVLSGMPGSRPALIDFAYLISKKNALIVCGHIIIVMFCHCSSAKIRLNEIRVLQHQQTSRERQETISRACGYLRCNKIKAFYSLIDSMNLHKGVTALLETVGVGKMRPNILLMGYKNDWQTCDRDALDQYFGAIQ
jgi:solute carrier family 12 (sodium/potassium/chloride transporter), member 2